MYEFQLKRKDNNFINESPIPFIPFLNDAWKKANQFECYECNQFKLNRGKSVYGTCNKKNCIKKGKDKNYCNPKAKEFLRTICYGCGKKSSNNIKIKMNWINIVKTMKYFISFICKDCFEVLKSNIIVENGKNIFYNEYSIVIKEQKCNNCNNIYDQFRTRSGSFVITCNKNCNSK